MGEKNRQSAFELFARVYPHEAAEIDPERFWRFFQSQYPGVTREQMEECLRESVWQS